VKPEVASADAAVDDVLVVDDARDERAQCVGDRDVVQRRAQVLERAPSVPVVREQLE